MRIARVFAALAFVLCGSAALADGYNGGGGVTPGSTCGDSSHALSWTGTAFACQSITGTAAAGGSNTQLQYNNSTALGGIAGATTDGTVVTFANSDVKLGGSSTGVTTFTSDNAGASNFTLHVPAANDTLVDLAGTQTLTGKTFDTAGSGNIFKINGTSITAISGTGSVCMTTSCAMTTPNLGTPSAVTLTNGTGLPLAGLASQAADTLVANATGGSAAPTAVTIGSCSTASSALTYNTSTHAFGCNSISGGGSLTVGTTTIASGTNTAIEFNNSGTLGEYTISGTGTVVAMVAGPTFTGTVTTSALTANGAVTHNAGAVFGAQTKAFGTTGAGVQGAWTHTDSTTGAGTVTTNYEHVFGVVTQTTPTNAITITNDYGTWFEPPTAGTHITITNKFAAGFNGRLSLVDGAKNAPSLTFGTAGTGFFHNVGDQSCYTSSNHNPICFSDPGISMGSGGPLGWTATANDGSAGSMDTALSRDAAGVIDIGTGAAGSKAGTLNLTTMGLQGVAVGSLPASPVAGMVAYVTDANAACTAGTTVAGGGSTKCFVGYNGSAWKEFGI